MIVKYLSYPYLEQNPAYGKGHINLDFEQCKSIDCGDSCNTFDFKMNNHLGTHIDAPNHFFNEGAKLTEINPSDLIFNNIQTMEINVEDGFLIKPQHLSASLEKDCDLLILKTNSYKFRDSDRYSLEGYGVSSDLGLFLQKNAPNLKSILLDTISLSSFQDRVEGRKSHKVFLNPKSPILIIEDANLAPLENLGSPKKVIVAPWLLGFADSAPCTILGFW
jgi:arylformamidase